METRRDWHEDDEFWKLAEPFMFDDIRIQSARPEVEQIVNLARIEPPASVLDLCCGPGRHSVEFARKGFAVTGVDRTARYLERARKAAGGLPVEWVHEDARRFVRPGRFDLAVNLYTSFGYFESPEDDLLVASNFAESLKPGGMLVMQLMGKEVIVKRFAERTWEQRGDATLLQDHRLHPNFSAIENRWTLLTPSGVKEIGFVVRLYAATEMEALLRRAGFSTVRFLGSLEGLPYDQTALRMVVLARKE
ncbi:MAG TPA: class I SAM-dependent methyltransferase [Fimbriimonadaceae bacterium]|nr:class I SAM-dependent methyltransferase [Fimbriimonadaceae bacterium]